MKMNWIVSVAGALLGTAFFSSSQAATITVADGDVANLIQAIDDANATPEEDTSVLATNGTYVLTAVDNSALKGGNNGFPVITSPIVIQGNGSTIQRSEKAQEDFRFFYVIGEPKIGNGSLVLDRVTLTGGLMEESRGGAIRAEQAGLTLTRCALIQNSAGGSGGAIAGISGPVFLFQTLIVSNFSAANGGGVYSDGNVTVSNCAFVANISERNGGGLYCNEDNVMVVNSTFSGNSTRGGGGGIFSLADSLSLTNVTITLNICDSDEIPDQENFFDEDGGGIHVASGEGTLINTIIADNTDNTDPYGKGQGQEEEGPSLYHDIAITGKTMVTSLGYNLIGQIEGAWLDEATGDQFGNSEEPIDPMLEPLLNNGGGTLTHSLQGGSPALEGGDPAFPLDVLPYDQRGATNFPRIQGNRIDIGAFERRWLSQQITFPQPTNTYYGTQPFTVIATANSDLPVEFIVVSGPATSSGTNGSLITLTGFGPITIRASQPGDTNFAPAIPVERTFTNFPAPLTVTADDKTKTYGQSNPELTATITGFVNGEGTNAISGAPFLSTTAGDISPVNGSPYPITVSTGSLAADNYTFTFVDGDLTVTPTPLIITVSNTNRVYGATNPTFTVSYSGFVFYDDTNDIYVLPTVSTDANTNSNVGAYPILLTGGSDDNYDLIISNGVLTVTQAALVAVADSKTKVYGNTNPPLTISYVGFVNGDTNGVIDTPPTISTTATTNSGVGNYPITLMGGSDNNYSLTVSNGNLEVTPATLAITADNASRYYGAPNPEFTGTVSGLKNGDTVSVTYSSTADESSGPGQYPIIPFAGQLANYTVLATNGTLTILDYQAPVLTWPSGNLDYIVNGQLALIDPAATVSDVDSPNLSGAILTIDFAENGAAEDRLGLTNGNYVTISGTNILYNETVIGSFSGGNGTEPLVINFTGESVPVEVVQSVLRNVTYLNTSSSPSLLSRTVRAVLMDNTEVSSDSVTKQINIIVLPTNLAMSGGTIQFKAQLGLYTQSLTFTNTNVVSVTGFRVFISGLPSRIQVYNAAGTSNGVPYVQWNQPLAPGSTVTLVIEYFDPLRRGFPAPTLTVVMFNSDRTIAPKGTIQQVDRAMRLEDGSFLVEFKSQTNRVYYIQYTSELGGKGDQEPAGISKPEWKTATPYLNGNGTQMQWIDNGPPKTDVLPGSKGSRFYRVIWVAP